MKWIKLEDQKPEDGLEVLGYNKEWEDEDFNPSGIRLCFLSDVSGWLSSAWDSCGDTWYSCDESQPTHWMLKPEKPE